MTVRLLESFDTCTTTAQLAAGRWTTAQGATLASGRNGKGWNLGQPNVLRKTLDNQATWVVGCAFQAPLLGSEQIVFSVQDAGTTQVDVRVTALGAVRITRNGTELASSAAGVVSQAVWVHLGLLVTINNAGSYTVYLNGAALLTDASEDTQQTANAYGNSVVFGPGSAGNWYYDDCFIFDGSGSYNTTFPGECKVEALLPGGAGATTAWTPSAGSNYACVDEVPPTDDTDYVSSSTATQTDTYALGNLVTTSGTVHAVQAHIYARKDDAGAREAAIVLRPTSTDRVGTTVTLSTSYLHYLQHYDRDPDDASAWTIAEVNALEAGVQCIS